MTSRPIIKLGPLVAALATCSEPAAPPAQPVPVASVTVTPAADTLVFLGEFLGLSATARAADGTVLAGRTFAWASTAPQFATVHPSTGAVTAVANGTAEIRATSGGVTGQAIVTVAQQVDSVAITPPTAGLAALAWTQQFAASALDARNNVIAGATFAWASSSDLIATVDGNGLATARGQGQATITATASGVSGNGVLTVTQVPTAVEFIALPINVVAGVEFSPAVEVEVRDANGYKVGDAQHTINLGLVMGGATLQGTTTRNASAGVAVFSGLTIERAAMWYALGASAPSIPGSYAISPLFDVVPGPSAQLVVGGHAGTVYVADTSFLAGVFIQDAFGNQVLTATDTVTISLSPASGGLVGDTVATAVNGAAVFSVAVQQPGEYVLRANASGFAEAQGLPFTVIAATRARR